MENNILKSMLIIFGVGLFFYVVSSSGGNALQNGINDIKLEKFNNAIDTIVAYERYEMLLSKDRNDSFIDREFVLSELNLTIGDSLKKDTGSTYFYYKKKNDSKWLKHSFTFHGKYMRNK